MQGAQGEPAKLEETRVQIVLRAYASPIPLGSFAFGVGNVLYSAFLFRWIPQSEALMLAVMLLAFVAPLELFPCVMAFLARDTGGATAFGIFGAAWVVQGVQLLLGETQKPSVAVGIFLFCLMVCLGMLALITFPGKPLLGALLVVAVLRTMGAGLVELRVPHLVHVTAALGMLLAAFAFYAGVAFLEEDVKQILSPLTFRTGQAKAAMEGRLEEQLSTITREAGVRKQL